MTKSVVQYQASGPLQQEDQTSERDVPPNYRRLRRAASQGQRGPAEASGVGLKAASLIMNFIFEEPLIAVETHIHRLLNRSGIVHPTSTDVTTRNIDELTSKNYKCHAHEWLIQHGMQICRARNPRCEECVIQSYCEFYAERQAV
ncbi:endonuclease III domain-containing protein [Xanthomonas campestris]|nr:hypothetical protein [Xanthomonas campestris]